MNIDQIKQLKKGDKLKNFRYGYSYYRAKVVDVCHDDNFIVLRTKGIFGFKIHREYLSAEGYSFRNCQKIS